MDAIIRTAGGLIIHHAGNTKNVPTDHKKFADILEAARNKDYKKAMELVDIVNSIKTFGQGKIEVNGGVIYYDSKPLHNVMTQRMLRMIEEGFDVNPFVAFLENLYQNPSYTAVNELYLFLEAGELPITEDGHFLAYKKVRDNFFDIHSNTFDNSPGQKPSMPRHQVDDKRERTCSRGLHFCSLAYLPQFGNGDGDKVVILKINPKDVVSIPSDYNNTKGRACEYEVIEEYKGDIREHAFNKSVWTQPELSEEVEEEEEDSWGEEEESHYEDSFGDEETVEETVDEVGVDGGTFTVSATEEAALIRNNRKVPLAIASLVGTTRSTASGTYLVVDVQGPERNERGHYTGDWLVVIRDTSNNFEEVTTYQTILDHTKEVPDVVERQGQGVELAQSTLQTHLNDLEKRRK